MDLAQTLVRSVARAFYDPRTVDTRHIVIVDALIIHSALRDDDLAYLMAQNTKDLHKICGRLREDRFIQVHVRPELREGQQRPTNRTYYYIDYRQAIDAIKWRVYTLDKAVQGNAVPESEKKEYFCSFCKAEWTMIEAVDNMGPKGFLCHRCSHLLSHDPERQSGGHEQSTRLNNQLKFITDLLPQLDSVHVPDNTFDVALAAARPVERDATNQVAASTVVEEARPTAVRGMIDTGPKSIAINLTATDGPSEAEKEAERVKKEKLAAQNALPSWHTTSTVTGLAFAGDTSTPAHQKDDEEDKKQDGELSAEQEKDMADLFARLKEQQEAEAARQAAEDEEEEGEEEEEFEDVGNASSVGEKRAVSSGDTSAAATPASEGRPLKKVKVEEPAPDDSEEEDVAFEDV